jgi:site-specific DNA recombinase
MAAIGKGQAPFGFKWKGGTLRIDPAKAKVRRRAFELFRELKSKGAVARRLNEEGAATRRGGPWSDMQIGRLLSCPSAVGRYVFNKTRGVSAGSRVETEEADRVHIVCDTIVPRTLWDEVAAVLQSQADSPSRESASVYPLVGLAFCACGQKMQVPSGTPKYVCPACQNKIPIVDLEGILLDELVDFVGNRPDFAELMADSPERAAVRDSIREVERSIETARGEQSKVEKLLLDELITPERFGELHRPLDLQIGKGAAKLSELEKRLSKLPPSKPRHGSMGAAELAKRWPHFPAATRRRLARSFVERIVVGEGDIEIFYWFGDSPSKDVPSTQQTKSPTNQPIPRRRSADAPVYVRLPKSGERCKYSGLTRSKLNDLILPTERNNYRPPVESKSLRGRGAKRGIRLILLESLLAHVADHA